MTERKIVIKTCEECPHLINEGQYGIISKLMVCGEKENRLLPDANGLSPTHEIPEWCPLEENK